MRRQHNGFSLPELCVVAALIGIAAAMAAPAIGQWQWRARVENTAQAWAADLQSARLHVLRTGQAMQLQRLNNCTPNKLPNGDWRCGWELVNPADNSQTAVLSSALNGDLSVVLAPAQNQLPINAQGEPVYKARPSPTNLQGGQPDLVIRPDDLIPPNIMPPPMNVPIQGIYGQSNLTPPQPQHNINSTYNGPDIYAGYDEQNQTIGLNTPLDKMFNQTTGVSPNPMDHNWGGVEFTENLVKAGYYKGGEVSNAFV